MWIARICLISLVIALLSSTLTAAWLDFKWLMYTHADKVGHLVGSLFITAASLLTFPKVRAAWVFLSTILLAGIIELMQLAGPRSADIIDFSASLAGISIAAILFYAPEMRRWMQSEPR